MTEPNVDDVAQALIPLTFGFTLSQISGTLFRLGVPDALNGSPKSVDELARATGSDPAFLRRLLRAAAAMGLVTVEEEDRFGLTAIGRIGNDPLLPFRKIAELYAHPAVWQAWGALEDAVRTGKPAFDHVHGTGVFDYSQQDQQFAALFHSLMASLTAIQQPQLVRHYDFSGVRRIVDVGGGDGSMLALVLGANGDVRGTVFDMAEALHGAPAVLREAGVADRCDTITGSFLKSVPPGADVYLLKNILHNWDDESCVTILRNCREAMDAQAKLLVITPLVPEQHDVANSADALQISILDIEMMVVTTGRERTLTEYERLFTAAGLRLGDVTRAQMRDGTVNTLVGPPIYHVVEVLPA